jgi:pyruvate-formate lyase-activating enzyme
VALISLTTFCNAHCRFCCVLDILNRPELNPEDEAIFARIADARAQGCTTLGFTGGEPTVHPRFAEFCRRGRELGFASITINTNGIKFKSARWTEEALAAGLTHIDFSIHGDDAPLHDAMMDREGAFDAFKKGMEHLRALGERYPVVLGATTVVTARNALRLPKIAEMLLDEGIRSLRFKHCFEGGEGADSLSGGDGADRYFVDDTNDQVFELAGQGSDTVYAMVDFTLASGQAIEKLRAHAGTTGLSLTGNDLANRLYGGNGDDQLKGGGGRDQLGPRRHAELEEGVAGAGRGRRAIDLDALVGQAGIDLVPGAGRVQDEGAVRTRDFLRQAFVQIIQFEVEAVAGAGGGDDDAVIADLQLDDVGDAVRSALVELGLFHLARGVGDIGIARPHPRTQQLDAAAGASRFDYRRRILRPDTLELFGDRGGERIDRRRPDDANLGAVAARTAAEQRRADQRHQHRDADTDRPRG